MFGYVRPHIGELRVWEEAYYRSAYCGLCRCLGKRYGFFCRFLVNYDITFLYLLLAGKEDAEECKRHFCPANPIKPKKCIAITTTMEYTADICVLLCCLSIDDKRKDEKGLKRFLSNILWMLFYSSFRKASIRHPFFSQFANQQLSLLRHLENEKCTSMDRVADAFATVLSHCADEVLTEEKRPEQQLLYHVGRYIYLTDALDDLSIDAKNGTYNPLRYRFPDSNMTLSFENRAYVKDSILHSVAIARAALPLCDLKRNESILENIMSLGLPSVLNLVDQGKFHAKRKMKATGEI